MLPTRDLSVLHDGVVALRLAVRALHVEGAEQALPDVGVVLPRAERGGPRPRSEWRTSETEEGTAEAFQRFWGGGWKLAGGCG